MDGIHSNFEPGANNCDCSRPEARPRLERTRVGYDDWADKIVFYTCQACSQQWLFYAMEDSWVSKSGRYWMVAVNHAPADEEAKSVVESAPWCIAGGSYHLPGKHGKRLFMADGTERKVHGFVMRAPIVVR